MTQHEPRDAYLSLRRFQTFFRDAVEPLVWPIAAPARAEAARLPNPKADPITAEAAERLTYSPVDLPWRWGPKWSTTWFRVSAEIPAAWKGLGVALRFSSGTEAQIWRAGLDGAHGTPTATALQGLDVNRDAYHLTTSAAGGERVGALIEAACNHPFGVIGFEWDHTEVHQRWNSAEPGLLNRCELAVFSPVAWELRQRYAVALQLLQELPLDSNRAQQLIAALRDATNAIPPASPSLPGGGRGEGRETQYSLQRAIDILGRVLNSPPAGSTTRCFAVGHAHLDTAWLWPLRETKRKLIRTFSNQLGNMERFPEYVFLASQTQHYAWAEERDPALFDRIKARVAEGRWEAGGAMWIEPDVNCVSGESLVRQILIGERWWRSRFGDKARQRFLYLPDTFGFGSSLPQIMRLAGLDTFITNKLHWWQHTDFPFTTFVWRGIDGTAVLGHNTPGRDYNATNTPKELLRGEAHHRNKSNLPSDSPRTETAPWLQPFGFGDGGGGSTDWSIRFAQLAQGCEGLPRVSFSTVSAFCDELHDHQRRGANYPEWAGELDMEIHRGTLTSQAWIKRANAQAEDALRLAEILAASLSSPSLSGGVKAEGFLTAQWKVALLNQFHDILPGSSIGWVYDDAREQHATLQAELAEVTSGLMRELATKAGPDAVFNPSSRPFTGVVDHEGTPVFVRDVPALGTASVESAATPPAPVHADNAQNEIRLSGESLATIDPTTGNLASLSTKDLGNILAGVGGLALYEDLPIMWDAWDIDHYYPEKPIALGPVESCSVVERHPLRTTVEIVRRLTPRSRATIRAVLHAGSPRLDLRLIVDWNEKHALLRYELPVALGPTAVCTHGTHFGHQTRPTHRNTAHERARFEFPAHGWLDLSEMGRGLAMLTDYKFGFSCWRDGAGGVDGAGGGHKMGVSLLRAPTHPDPHADEGRHEFTISLLPHRGDWRAASVAHHAEILRASPRFLPNVNTTASTSAPSHPFTIECSGHASAQISAFKPAVEGDALILRLFECHGGPGVCTIRWSSPVRSVNVVDLLERESEHAIGSCEHRGNVSTIPLKPFQIVTLRIER